MKLNEMKNYEAIKANYIKALDELAEKEIAELSRNDMAQIMAVSYGSIKAATERGKTNEEILNGTKIAKSAIQKYLKTLTADEVKALMA